MRVPEQRTMTVRRCAVCRVNGTTVSLEESKLPGRWRCRDQVNCRRRVKGIVKSRELADSLREDELGSPS
jgi:hypothetical protein